MLVVLALLSFFGPARADEGSWRERLNQAERLSGEGKDEEAVRALKKALALKPDDLEAEDELVRVYDGMGRFEEEVPLLKGMIEKAPRIYSHYDQLAKAYIRLGRSVEAKDTYAQGKKINGKTAEAYVREGYFNVDLGDFVHAKEDFEGAISVDTASPVGYHHMGSYLFACGRYSESEKYFRRALELEADPNAHVGSYLHTLSRLHRAIRAQGRYADADAVYYKGVEKVASSRDARSLGALASLYAAQGKSAQAEETYTRAVTLCAGRSACSCSEAGDALINLGQFYLKQGRRAEAEAAAERIEKSCADVRAAEWLNVQSDLAAFYADLGDVSRLRALYARLMPLRRTMPFDPDLVWVETGLAGMEAASGRFSEAEIDYRQAIGVLDHNGYWEEEAAVLDNLAAIYDKEGRAAAGEAREKAKSLRARP